MKIAVCVRRVVVVDDDIHTFDIDTTTENICCHQNTLLEILECTVTLNAVIQNQYDEAMSERLTIPFLLGEARVDTDTREVAGDEKLVQLDCASNGLDENDHLGKE